MRRGLLAVACTLLCSTTAWAGGGDDYRPITPWTGFYAGAHAGYGWGDFNVDLSNSSGALHYNDPFAQPQQSLGDGSGWIGGLQIGANRQFGNFLFGVEADASWTGLESDGSTFTTAPGGACGASGCTQWNVKGGLDVFGTVRARAGIVRGLSHYYLTAGLAWGITDFSVAANHNPPNYATEGGRVSGETTHLGWTIGGGAEWAIARNWTMKAEYLYVDLGEENYALKGTTTPGGTTPYTETFAADLSFHTVRVGLNYRFGD